jgi:integrase
MGVYKRTGSPFYYYEFEFNKKTHRKSTGTKLLHEARAIEAKARAELEADLKAERSGSKRMMLGDLAAAWLESARIAHRDWKNDESRVRKLFGRTLKEVRTVDAGKVVGRDWVETQATYPHPITGEEVPRFALDPSLKVHELSQALMLELRDARYREGNSPATINREMALVQSLLSYAESLQVVTPQPPLKFSAKRAQAGSLKLKEAPGKLRFLTEDEEAQLFAALWQKYESWGERISILDQIDLCVFLLDTGARYNEVVKLTWDVVDLEKREINLYRGKGGRASTLAMTERLYRSLEARRELTGARRYIFPAGDGHHGWHHEDRPRGHATAGIQATMDGLGFNTPDKAEALGRATPHTFRDTFASRLIQRGFTLYEVQTLLGHASPAMTQKYAKLLVKDVSARAANTLGQTQGQSHPWRRTPADGIRGTVVEVLEANPPVEKDPSAPGGPHTCPPSKVHTLSIVTLPT